MFKCKNSKYDNSCSDTKQRLHTHRSCLTSLMIDALGLHDVTIMMQSVLYQLIEDRLHHYCDRSLVTSDMSDVCEDVVWCLNMNYRFHCSYI